jgi:branched-chain amino acid transport system permease protein
MLGSIYAMVGVAMTLSIGILRFLNFSIPALFMIGGMVTWALVHAGVPWPVAVLAALAAGAAVALIVEAFTWRSPWRTGVRISKPCRGSSAPAPTGASEISW